MAKKIVLNLLLLVLFFPVLAKNFSSPDITSLPGSLSGKITDKNTHEPIAGATIYIPDLKNGTVTDPNGQYKLEHLPAAKLLLQVSYLGFKTIVQTIDCSVTTIKDFEMETSITEIPELVITGTSRAAEIRKNPVPMALMDRKEIDQVTSTNIIDVISKVPGVSAVTTGPNISKPFIHGLGYNRVLTLVNGIRQEGQQWGAEHGIEVDENRISKVEIVKGPASLTYGSDALAGVINLITRPPASTDEIKSGLLAEYQTNNKLIGSSVFCRWKSQRLDMGRSGLLQNGCQLPESD
jgi:iron complex outermembrane receptor protein